ncbi:DUF6959 family protein [Labilithrix luteola]|uniref:DUF6959 family protein n=1 Tax=Labilithrix luteola TaxID=1391654 RepID=UPI0011BAA042|nr:hypothetical protein [Labilithrix luteola]
MTTETADVLARHGNVAVVQLSGRKFPGITIQGDSFSYLAGLAKSVAARAAQMGDADLDDAASELRERLEGILQVYETPLSEHGIPLPYVRSAPPASDSQS